MTTMLVTTACTTCICGLLAAQSEKINISVIPRSGQIVHYVVTSEYSMASAESRLPRSVTLKGKLVATYTMVGVAANQRGHFTTQMTIDQQSADLTSDGSSPKDKDPVSPFPGKTFTVAFGADGDIIDVTGPPMGPGGTDTMKRGMAEFYRYLPTATLSVGETIVQPAAIGAPAMLLPLAPFTVEGHVALKLVSIEADRGDRIAYCEQSYDVRLVEPTEVSAPGVRSRLDVRIRGSRKMQVNLNRGILKASQMETTFESADTAMYNMRGVMKATVTGTY